MADNSWYSFSDPLNSGIDFYQADSNDVAVFLSGSVNLTVGLTKVISIQSNQSVSADTVTNAIKIAYAAANLSINGATVTIATEIQDGVIVISGEVTVTQVVTKIAYASVNISVSADMSSIGTKIAKGIVDISSSADASASSSKFAYSLANLTSSTNASTIATKIQFIGALLSGNVNLSIVGKIVLTTIKINILNNTNINADLIRFSNNITADSSLIRTLLLLDGKPLTNQTRSFDSSLTPIFIENTNWAGDSSRYYKNNAANSSGKRTFNINWSFIPNYSNKTVDNKESRNYIKSVAMDADTHTLTVISQNESGVTPYTEEQVTVFVSSFSENLIRRDLVDNVYYFDCSMTLEEV
jgi:hypothetical protein